MRACSNPPLIEAGKEEERKGEEESVQVVVKKHVCFQGHISSLLTGHDDEGLVPQWKCQIKDIYLP